MEVAQLERHLRITPKLSKALIHTSSGADDPYVKDEAPPSMVLQLYFPEVHELEAALSLTFSSPIAHTSSTSVPNCISSVSALSDDVLRFLLATRFLGEA